MKDKIDLNYFKKCLEERLESIETSKERQKKDGATVELDQARVGRLTRMDAMQQQAMSQATARLSQVESQRIQSALARMQAGEYGYCVICGEEIAEGRLRFDPSVVACISCAKEAEEKKGKTGR